MPRGKNVQFFLLCFSCQDGRVENLKKKKWLFYIHNNAYNCFHITYMKFISL